MESVKFHCQSKPKEGEIVQVVFTTRHEDHTEGYLVDYEGSIIMIHSQATKKKKIKSFNKTIPLEQPLAAVIEDFDSTRNMGSVSRAYLEDSEENYTDKFHQNSRLFRTIYQACHSSNVDFKSLWEDKIYPFISDFSLKEKDTYFSVFINSMSELEPLISNEELLNKIKEKIETVNIKKETFKKNIGIISNEGVELTKKVLQSSLDTFENSDNISVKYSNTPNYSVESDESMDYIINFVEFLKKKANESGKIFIKD